VLLDDGVYTLAFVVGVPMTTISLLLDAAYTAERSSGKRLARNACFVGLRLPLLGALIMVAAHRGALAIFGAWVLAGWLSLLYGGVLVRGLGRGFRPEFRGIAAETRGLFSSLVRQHLVNLGATAPAYLLPVLVTVRLSPADNAYFYTTWMLGGTFFMISASVATSLFAEGIHVTAGIPRQIRSSVQLIAVMVVPLMLVMIFAGRTVLSLFGAAYAHHGLSLLLVLTASAVPDAITNVYVSILRVKHQLDVAVALNVGMASLTLVLAWLLLPQYGITGAGLAWLFGEIAGSAFVAVHYLVQRRSPDRGSPRTASSATGNGD